MYGNERATYLSYASCFEPLSGTPFRLAKLCYSLLLALKGTRLVPTGRFELPTFAV